jgi:hypothetical protein
MFVTEIAQSREKFKVGSTDAQQAERVRAKVAKSEEKTSNKQS